MAFFVPEPNGLSWDEWSAAFAGYSDIPNVPWPLPEDAWREWAEHLQLLPTLEGYQVPDPHSFEEWSGWAEALSFALVSFI